MLRAGVRGNEHNQHPDMMQFRVGRRSGGLPRAHPRLSETPSVKFSSSTSQFLDKYDALRGYRQLGRERHDPGLAVGGVNAGFAAWQGFEHREQGLALLHAAVRDDGA